MLSVLDSALAGIQSNQLGLLVAANNIANLNTEGYRAQRHDPATGRAEPRCDPPLAPPGGATLDGPASDVDLTTELIELKRHEYGFRANLHVAVIAGRMSGELLDIFA